MVGLKFMIIFASFRVDIRIDSLLCLLEAKKCEYQANQYEINAP